MKTYQWVIAKHSKEWEVAEVLTLFDGSKEYGLWGRYETLPEEDIVEKGQTWTNQQEES